MATANDRIKQCYIHEEDHVAMKCIQDAVAESKEESCVPKIVLLVQEGCGGCQQEKQRYAADIEAGKIRVVDITTPEGIDIAGRNQVEMVPAVLILDCENRAID